MTRFLISFDDGSMDHLSNDDLPAEPTIAMQIPVERITEAQRDYYLTVGGLSGNELTGEIMDDSGEYDGLVAEMIKTLARYGKIGIDNDCPYYMNRYAPADYFPFVEVKGVEFITLALIADLHSDLRDMPMKYRIDVCSAIPYWNDELNIFIEHSHIYWFSDDGTAEQIGLLGLEFLPVSNLKRRGTDGG